MSATDTGWARRDYPRTCDICGHRFKFSALKSIGEMKFACPDDAKGLTATQISRYNARARPVQVKPHKHAKPDGYVDSFQMSEARIFNAITSERVLGEDGVVRSGLAPYELLDIGGPGPGRPFPRTAGAPAETPRAAGWAAIYLYGVIQSEDRPRAWGTRASAKLGELGDWLLAHQFTSSGGAAYAASAAATLTVYGGFPRDGAAGATATIYAEDQAVALIALVRAYQTNGTMRHLLGARAAATCLRRIQAGGYRTTAYLVSNAGGARLEPGPFPVSITATKAGGVFTTTTHSTSLRPADLIAAIAFKVLQEAEGDSTYGDATAVGEFALATAGTLSAASAAAVSWWATAQLGSDGVAIAGLSATTPRESYTVTTSAAPGAPAWAYARTVSGVSYVTSRNFAMALYALDEMGEDVTVVYAWLRATAADPAHALADDTSDWATARLTSGPFDATLAPAAEIAVLSGSTSVNVAGAAFYAPHGLGSTPGPLYDFAAEGLLAGIRSPLDGTRTTKRTIEAQRRRRQSPAATLAASAPAWLSSDQEDDIQQRGKAGLSLQTGFKEQLEDGSMYAFRDMAAAAMVGALYRANPVAGIFEE